MSNKLINSGNLSQALTAFYTKSTALFATKTELDSGLAGKANSSHGTHVTYATAVPKANGTAAIGTVNRVAREDHVHPLQTTVSGNAGSANKVNSSLAIKLNGGTTEGTNLFTFNGSTAKTIDITPASIGASATGHNHDDRYYTESEINTKVNNLNTAISTAQTAAQTYADNKIAALVDSAPDAMNTLNELATAINDHQDVYTAYVEEMTTALAGKANSSHGNHVPEVQTASNKVFLRNDNTWATITPANIGAAPTSHASSATTYGVSSASNYGHAKASGTTPKANGTAAVGSETSSFARGDHVHPLQTSVSGNAGTATKFASAQSVALTGDVTGSASSQAGWSVTTTLANSGVTAGSYGQAENASPAHKGTFSVPYITVDAKGRITSASTQTITLPADNNTTYTNEKLGNGYGACETAEATAAKVVTLSNYTLVKNGIVSVKFTYAVPANATMNINSKGAKNIYFRGAKITAGIIKAGDIATFMYDGTQYQLISIDRWQNDLTSHTHNYAGSSSAGGAATSANKVNTNLTIKLNSGSTEGTDLFTFNGSTAKTINITPSAIGAAASSHGTHVTYATVAGKANGTAAVGTSSKVAREDHVHPLQTSVSGSSGSCTGNAASATKVNNSLVIKLNSGTTEGTDMFTFNGSAAKTIDLQCATEEEITAMIDEIWG